jgi:gas vesicle protein
LRRFRTYWIGQAKLWGSRSLEWWAAHLTGLYVGGAITIMGAKFDDLIALKLNEIGDLAAGVFGPVAFLWLVLGYIQQGRELKLSSAALQLQAQELQKSVEQQKELVAISREQVKTEIENIKSAREQRAKSIRPLFIISGNGGSHVGSQHELEFSVQNLGSPVTSVNFDFSDQFVFSGQAKHLMERKDVARFKLNVEGRGDGVGDKLTVTYLDADFTPGVCMFSITVVPDDRYPSLKFEQL